MLPLESPQLSESQNLALNRHHRAIARRLAVAGAALVLVAAPLYQFQDFLLAEGIPDLWWWNAGWRAIPIIVAILTLVWCSTRTDGYGAPAILRLLALSVMVMIFGLFATSWLAGSDTIDRMVRGVIICTFAVALFSLRGYRELIVFFGLPFVVMLAVLQMRGESLLAPIAALFDPLMMFLVAAVASELIFRTWLDAFVANQQLAEHASTDPLTGLSNRRYIEPQLAGETARALRHKATFSILLADLDHFKQVNDQYGHDTGDEVLREVARRFQSLLRTEDRAARWGGEEFLILLTDTDVDQAVVVAEKIRRAIAENPVDCDHHRIPITVSIGVAGHDGEREPLKIIKRADQALYRAKGEGRNRVCVGDN